MLIILLALSILATASLSAGAQYRSAPEYSVKAAFLYNFVKFVKWPDNAFLDNSSVVSLCVFDDNAFSKVLADSVRDKTVKGRKIAVNNIYEPWDTASCQVVFIGSSDKKRIRQIMNSVNGKKILTVGALEGFARRGGMINFVMVENKISFEINIDAVKRSGLVISSQLLKLAEIIREK